MRPYELFFQLKFCINIDLLQGNVLTNHFQTIRPTSAHFDLCTKTIVQSKPWTTTLARYRKFSYWFQQWIIRKKMYLS